MKTKTKFLLLLFLLMEPMATVVYSQSVTTESISFRFEDVSDMFMPPDIRMDINFVDANNNDILEAEESGVVRINLTNQGGRADDVKITIYPLSLSDEIQIAQCVYTTTVDRQGSSVIEIPLYAKIDVPTGFSKFGITVSEPMGYDIHATLELSTFAFQKAYLKMNGVEITDAGKDLRAFNGNPDNKIQNLDVARASVMIQNIGKGQAEDVEYEIISKDPNVKFLTQSGYASEIRGSIGDLLIGQTSEISFRLSPNAHYINKSEYIPVYLTVKEKKGFGDLVSKQIPIPFDAVAVKPEIVKVEGDTKKLMASLGTKVYSEDARVTSDVKFKDILVVPYGEAIYPNAVAIVIGAEEYYDKNIPQAPYAARDASVMAEYFKKALGISNVQLMTNEQATNMQFKKTFDATKGALAETVVSGKTDVFVYYSGHGVPMENNNGRKDIFLIPYDVEKDWIKDEGYSLNKLYSNLSKLNAKSVTVIIDACFSGGSRRSDVYATKSIANQKLVIVDSSDMEQPWLDNPNFRVFSSSRGDQPSLGYDKSQSGLFTYFLAVGLQGDADKDKNGSVTMKELVEFVTSNVHDVSEGSQTPQFYGNDDYVVEKIK